jgi:HEAT repeat protein
VVGSHAAWALGLKGDSRAVAPLKNALNDSDAEVRKQARWALEMRGMRSGRGIKIKEKDKDKDKDKDVDVDVNVNVDVDVKVDPKVKVKTKK